MTLVSGSAPVVSGTNGQFLYDSDDGRLFWDDDGTGSNAAVLIATLQSAPALQPSDIIVGGSAAPAEAPSGGAAAAVFSVFKDPNGSSGVMEISGDGYDAAAALPVASKTEGSDCVLESSAADFESSGTSSLRALTDAKAPMDEAGCGLTPKADVYDYIADGATLTGATAHSGLAQFDWTSGADAGPFSAIAPRPAGLPLADDRDAPAPAGDLAEPTGDADAADWNPDDFAFSVDPADPDGWHQV